VPDDATADLARSHYQLPAVIHRNERIVERSFWRKLAKVMAYIPFAEELITAYFCAADRQTPTRVRAVLLAALAYFILPMDLLPDFIISLGFTDDATVLTAAFALIQGHITDSHRQQARNVLARLDPHRASSTVR
jgi:uncharacterized membrane protein YkvA (DUF1232 family)